MMEGPDTSISSPGGSQAVTRALSLLSLVGRGGADGLGLTELAEAARLTIPTTRRLLLALLASRLADQDRLTRRYHLGPEAYLLGSFAENRHGILHHARPSMLRLAEETGDTIFLTVPQDDHTLCLERIEGTFPIRTHALMRGDRKPAGMGAGALAILAALPEAEANALLERAAPFNGPLAKDLPDDVALARQQGYAFNPGRVVRGSWGLAVVILWPEGRPAGALSIAAIDDRMSAGRHPELVLALKREAHLIEARLAELGTKTQTAGKRRKV